MMEPSINARVRRLLGVLRAAAMLLLGVVMTGADPVMAQTPGVLFVLSTSATSLDKSAVDGKLDVPLYWLETDRVALLVDEIRRGLPDVEGLSEEDVTALLPRIEATGRELIAPRLDAIKQAYRDAAIAGEISVRFGVKNLPAVVEVSDNGYFRRLEGITSVLGAIQQLESLPYRHESDGLPRGAAEAGGFIKVRLDDNTGRSESVDKPSRKPQPQAATADPRELLCESFDPSSLINFGDGILRLAEPGGGYCGTGKAQGTRYSLINALIDASSPASFDCMNLSLSGLCLYLTTRVYCTLAGCSIDVTPETSFELTHFNPDALVGISKRLGASPLAEAELLYGALQNTLSRPVMEALMRRSAPPGYDNPNLWAGGGTESQTEGTKSTMKYHEVDIIGHPGSIFQFIDESGLDTAGLQEKFTQIPTHVTEGARSGTSQITGTTTSRNLNDVFGHADIISELPGWEAHPPESLIAIARHIFPADIVGAVSSMAEVSGTISHLFSTWETVSNASMTDLTSALTESLIALLPEEFEEAVEIHRQIEGLKESFAGTPGIGESRIDLFRFCPSDTDIMKPYFLSGIDIPQWRFNIPEIVYPQTYAFPLPGSDLYIGLADGISDSEVEDTEGRRFPLSPVVTTFASLSGAWGSVYPRQGYSTQRDEMKAAAVAGFRAAHVVSRPGQKHIYNVIPPRETEYLAVTHPPAITPNDEAGGQWQLVAPKVSDQCILFGQDDTLLDPWTRNRQSDDRMYGFTWWRQYSCCPSPQKAGAVAMFVTDLGKIPLDIELM